MTDLGIVEEKVRQLEERAEKWDAAVARIDSAVADVKAGIARMEGSLDGAFRAKKISGAFIGVLISVGAGALTALLLALIRASGH